MLCSLEEGGTPRGKCITQCRNCSVHNLAQNFMLKLLLFPNVLK